METSVAREDALLARRQEFPSLEGVLHFVSHSLGAMPSGAGEALERVGRLWATRGIRAWEDEWFGLPIRVAGVIERILGAAPGSVSMHPNVTLAQAVALSAVSFAPPRNRLVCGAEDFPSVLYLYEGLERRGVEIVRVAARDGRHMTEDHIVAAIDERTAVVALSQVMFRSSQVLDLAPIVRRAKECGALTLIDAYQAIGTVPTNVEALGVDMLAGGSVKWLCGGPGASYLYVRPELAARLEPAITGWLAHEQPFAFDPGPIRRDAGPRRFWTGTPPIASIAAAEAGFTIVAEVGVEAIRAKSLRQTERMIGWADELGMKVTSPRDAQGRGGTVVLDVPRSGDVCKALLAKDVLLDERPDVGLRVAPHFYTRDDEIDEVMRRIADEARRAVAS